MSYPSAWQCLLAARAMDWSESPGRTLRIRDTSLEVFAGGRWRSDKMLPEAERQLMDMLLPLTARAGTLVLGQLGQSLDGKIATESGDSWYINGRLARSHLHRLRALVDAVVVGAGTAAEDRPQLNVRHVEGPDPVPVVLDPRGRVDPVGPLFARQAHQPTVLHLVGADLELPDTPAGVERLVVPVDAQGRVAPQTIVQVLAGRGLGRVLIEGGGVTVSEFVDADCLDHLHLLVAPLIIGSGRPGLVLPPIERLSEARRPPIRSFPLGDELLVDVRLR